MKHKTYTDGILYNGDCLKVMPKLIEQGIKVDAIICDIPYGTTQCSWDSVIPFDKMWDNLNKLIKDNGAIVLFGSEPFSTCLRYSNLKDFKYDWIWEKVNSTGFQLANCKPLKKHEVISVFSKGVLSPTSKNKMIYYPQGIKKANFINKRSSNGEIISNGGEHWNNSYIQEYTNYPTDILKFNYDKLKYHPTQKPINLMEYLVQTYTNKGETVLDFTCGSGSTLIACRDLNRRFIGIEMENKYYKICKQRLAHECRKSLF